MLSKNTFINCVKRLLIVGETKGRVEALREVKALLLLTLDLLAKSWPVSSSCFIRSARALTQGLHQTQDFEAIAKEEKEE